MEVPSAFLAFCDGNHALLVVPSQRVGVLGVILSKLLSKQCSYRCHGAHAMSL